MSDLMHFNIISSSSRDEKKGVSAVSLPAYSGQVEIRPDHHSYLALLKRGGIRVSTGEGHIWVYYLSEGTVEVRENRVRILCSIFERGEEMDLDMLNSEYKDCRARIKSANQGRIGSDELTVEIDRLDKLTIKLELLKFLKRSG